MFRTVLGIWSHLGDRLNGWVRTNDSVPRAEKFARTLARLIRAWPILPPRYNATFMMTLRHD